MKSFFALFALLLLIHPAFAQDYAIQQLENSPRHHEWVGIESNGRTLQNFVAYPEKEGKVPVVIVIHENRGLNDWARSFTDQLAEQGFIAIAPDLLTDSNGKKTSDFPTSDAARSAIYQLDADAVTSDLQNVLNYAKNIEAGNGKVVVIGFCWGGSQSFRFATNSGSNIEAAIVFYGTGPRNAEAYASIEAPVYGFYGGADNRVNATIPLSEESMKAADNFYEYEIYEGAGHAFMRRGDDPDEQGPNKTARNEAWKKLKKIIENL